MMSRRRLFWIASLIIRALVSPRLASAATQDQVALFHLNGGDPFYSAVGEVTVRNAGGNVLPASAYGNRLLFQGQLYDARFGTHAMRAREYSPTMGRFLSQDPIGVAGGANLYAFVDDRPLTGSDPFGLNPKGKDNEQLPDFQPPGWLDYLHFGQGYYTANYFAAIGNATSGQNSSYTRGISGAAAAICAFPAGLEMAAAGVGNVPYLVAYNADAAGQRAAAASLTTNYEKSADFVGAAIGFGTGGMVYGLAGASSLGLGAPAAAGLGAGEGIVAEGAPAARGTTGRLSTGPIVLEAAEGAATETINVLPSSGRVFVVTPGGQTVAIPEGWAGRVADNGKGIVFQEAAAAGNANMIRIMDPVSQYPAGYVRSYNGYGQPLDALGDPGSAATTHIPLDYMGTIKWPW